MKLSLFTGVVLGGAALNGCGYRAAALARDSGAPVYTLSAASAQTPHLDALESALAGARASLSRERALRTGSGYPRIVVELVRVDEVASGIAAMEIAPGSSAPLARASAVGVTARGWVEERAGGPPSRDSGDVRRVETVAQSGEVLGSSVAAGEAARSAARRAGEAVARRVLGIAEPGSEEM